jgi:hypothetical protein
LEGKNVVFLGSKRKLQSAPPLFFKEPSQDILKRILMKYVESGDSLRQYLVTLQQFPKLPQVIIVDDISLLVPG